MLAQGAAILDCFGDVDLADHFYAAKVGNGACHFQYAMVGARRPVQSRHRRTQQLLGSRVRPAMTVDFRGGEGAIGLALALQLARKSLFHACGDCLRSFAGSLFQQVFLRQRGHLDLQVDAIQQRPGDAILVTRYTIGRATAFVGSMAKVAAWTGVHCGHQLEARREVGLACRTRNRDLAGFERFAQDFQHFSIEFWQFIQEEYAAMRQRNLTWPRRAATVNSNKIADSILEISITYAII